MQTTTLVLNKRPSDEHFRKGSVSIQAAQLEEIHKVDKVQINVFDSNNVLTYVVESDAQSLYEKLMLSNFGEFAVLKFK